MPPQIDRVQEDEFSSGESHYDGFLILDAESPSTPAQVKRDIPALYVPEGFEPERYLTHERRRLGDKARYLLHAIHTQSIFNQRHRRDGVHLKAEYLRRIMGRHYLGIISDLEGPVIEVDRIARDGLSNRYRLNAEYRAARVKRFVPTDSYLIPKLIERRAELQESPTCPTRKHLLEQLRRVRLDLDSARRVLDGLSLDGERFAASESCLERLYEQEWFFSADRFGRVHHNITCLKRELRACLRVDGQGLIETDISNSQPLFCGLTFFLWEKNQGSFAQLWTEEAFNSALALKEENLEQLLLLKQELQKSTTTTNQTTLPLRCAGLHETNNDPLKYLMLCEEGRIYEYMAQAVGIDISDSAARGSFKEQVYSELLYAKWRDSKNPLVVAFQAEFPSLFEMIRQVNYRDHRRLAQWMQRVEARLVIDGVVAKFAEERPDAFILTIHDSVLTKPDDAKYVGDLFRQEFGRFGVHPTLKQK
ncbi:hypothetical protein AB1L30_10370 [Bremerella sp. JC817]|uniref:hypothetical protein n=1 Tax=Bremerella sp. JC817 TaxID=3231756 RepID=UPI00345788C7